MSLPDYGALGFRDIIVTLDGAVAVVLINRGKQSVPQYYSRSIQKSHGKTYCRRNSFGVTLVADLIQAFDLFDRDDRVRAVVVTAEATAPAYCSGVSSCCWKERISNADQLLLYKADISGGWSSLWNPASEKEGEHGALSLTQLPRKLC